MIKGDSFLEYCTAFYGKGGVFEYENLRPETLKAVCDLVEKEKGFLGDSTDRENVSAIIFSLGYREKVEAAALFLMTYECPCGECWTMCHECACDDRCPNCRTANSPVSVQDKESL